MPATAALAQPALTAAPARADFRPDINGLRALAILAVLAFHFRMPGMSGGFSGVDVFFVISGYLMTGIVVGRLVAGRFSLLDFYADRTLRIVPAMIALLVAILVFGWLALVPGEYAILGKSTVKAALFAGNLRFRIEYFGTEIDQEWLLHLWSLGVEWQFYLAFPLLVWALWRLGGRRAVAGGLALAALASFAVGVWLTFSWPIAGFYLLPARGWELIAGGLVWLAPPVPPRAGKGLAPAGLAMILAAAMLVGERGWPGWQALLPVGGTMAVIAAGQSQSRLTGNALLGWIGTHSYSIYLWHWPVALWILRYHPGAPLWIAGGIALSFALGHLSWRLIETVPRRVTNRRRAALALIAGLGVVAAAGWAVSQSQGLLSRYPPAVAAAMDGIAETAPFAEGCFSVVGKVPAPCTVGEGPIAANLIGDSHAASLAPGLVGALPAGRALGFNAYASCMPVLGGISPDPQNKCAAFNAALLAPLTRPRTTPVVLTANWQAYFDRGTMVFGSRDAAADPALLSRRFIATACALTRAGPTWATLPEPSFPIRVPYAIQAKALAGDRSPVTVPLAADRAAKAQAVAMLLRAQRQCGLRLIDPAAVLCRNGLCAGSQDGLPLFYDRDHLTARGARLLTPLFAPLFAPASAPPESRVSFSPVSPRLPGWASAPRRL